MIPVIISLALMAILITLITVLATALGGFLALRSRDRMHLLLGLSAGLLFGLVAFDLIPEVLELNTHRLAGIPTPMVAFVVGFLALHMMERFFGSHEPADSDYGDDHSHTRLSTGVIGAGAMVIHVFLDGVGVGLAFQVSNSVGFAVAIAVISHAFTDGLNTVMLLIRSGRWRTKAIALLALDGVARLLGATIGTYLTLSEPLLGIYLALFAGFLVYLSTSHVLPEAHSNHPSRWTLLATLLGVVVMFGIVSVGESA